MNPTRALQYVTQALAALAAVAAVTQFPQDVAGDVVSLRRNLESAQAELEPPQEV